MPERDDKFAPSVRCQACRGIGWVADPTSPTDSMVCTVCDGRGRLIVRKVGGCFVDEPSGLTCTYWLNDEPPEGKALFVLEAALSGSQGAPLMTERDGAPVVAFPIIRGETEPVVAGAGAPRQPRHWRWSTHRENRVLRWVEEWNRRVNGGWVTLHAAPPYGYGRWVVQIDPLDRAKRNLTIGSDSDLRTALRHAERWIAERADYTQVFQVKPYLDGAEYAAWVAHIGRSHVDG